MSKVNVFRNAPTDWARARWVAVIAVGVGFLAFLAVIISSTGERYRHALATAEREAENLARLVEEHAARTIGEVKATLDHTAARAATAGHVGADDREALHRFLRDERRVRGKQLRALFIVDADGAGVVDSESGPARQLDVSGSPGFIALRDDLAKDFYIGESVRSRFTGLWTTIMARRLSKPDGSFAGLAVAAIDPGYFAAFYRGIDIGSDSFVGLIHTSGRVLAGYSRFTDLGDVHLAGDPLFMHHIPTKPNGFYRGNFGTVVIPRLVAYRQASTLPIAVVVALAESDVLADWRRASTWNGVQIGLVTLVILCLGLLLGMRLRHLERMDRDLAEVASRFEVAVSGTRVAVWDWNLANDKVWFSPTWFDIAGVPPAERDTYVWRECIQPDDLIPFSAAVTRCIKGEDAEFYHLFRHADQKGGWLWIEAVGRLQPGVKAGDRGHFIGRLLDVTDRVQAEEALVRNEARFRDFAEASGHWLWETDADHRFTWFSPSVERLTSVKPELHLGKQRLDIAAEDLAQPHWQRHLDDLARRRPFRDFEYLRRGADSPDGMRWLRSSGVPTFDEAGRFLGYRGVGSDISALRLAELRLRDAVDSLPFGFILYDHNDRTVMFNLAGAQLLPGLPRAVRIGRTFEDTTREIIGRGLLPDADANPEAWLAERLRQHRNPGPPILVRHSGDRWVEVVERRTTDGGTILLRFDVTERIREQRRLSAALEKAETANRSKSVFLANMSHELRTPLNAIMGFAEVIAGEMLGPVGTSKYRTYGGDIHRSAEHLLELINQVLEMARIEAGKRELHLEPVNIDETVRVGLQLVRRQADLRNLTLDYVPCRAGLVQVVDKLAVRQVLVNLLSNAVKFTPPGGSIRVSSGLSGEFFVLEVSDTGIGIKPADLKRLGRPFELALVDPGGLLTSNETGTGLGLALSKGLTELHGGTLSIASEFGRGTTVTVRLPVHRQMRDAAVV